VGAICLSSGTDELPDHTETVIDTNEQASEERFTQNSSDRENQELME